MSVILWQELTAVGTILLAVATFVAVFWKPISERIKAPNVIVEPENAIYVIDNPTNYFATQKANGSERLHIWVRLSIKNTGKSMAKNVYVRLTSIERYNPTNGKLIKRITPFNPFRLWWVSEGTDAGNLINDESAYLNLCTLVGDYFQVQKSNSVYLLPVIVPGLPGISEGGTILGDGHVAGMDPSVYKSGLKAKYRYELIVGGSNINSKRYYVCLTYSLNRGIKEEIGKLNKFHDLHRYIMLKFQVNEEVLGKPHL